MILIFNILAGISIISIIGTLSLGRSTSYWEFITPVSVTVGILIAIILLASIYFSNRSGGSHQTAWASVGLVVFILVLIGAGFLVYLNALSKAMNTTGPGNFMYSEDETVKKNQIENILPSLSRDYVYQNETESPVKLFLTVDEKNKEIVLIVEDYGIRVTPVGKIVGNTLELAQPINQEGSADERYSKYFSPEGNTIYDDYEVKYTPSASGDEYDLYADYHLEQYK